MRTYSVIFVNFTLCCIYLLPLHSEELAQFNLETQEKAQPKATPTLKGSSVTTLPSHTRIDDATVSFSYAIEINSSKPLSSQELNLTLFLIEPNGNLQEANTPEFSLKEGKNIGGFTDIFALKNPLKGNYLVGCLARIRGANSDATVSFTGNSQAVLKKTLKEETFISSQIPKQNLSGKETTTFSSNIVLFDNL